MKGTTHLAIGCAIGAAAAGYHSFDFPASAWYIAAAAVSALAPDLDGPSMLSSRIGKASRAFYRSLVSLAVILTLLVVFLFLKYAIFQPGLAAAAGAAVLPAMIVKEGAIRNVFVSLIGAAAGLAGFSLGWLWLSGFGLYVLIAPWLKHRGLTHTVWALGLWYLLSLGLENRLGIKDLALTAGAGYASHLAADTLTASGVKWLYPLSKFTFKIPFR